MMNPVSSASTQSVSSATQPQATTKAAGTANNDASKVPAAGNNVGPAVIVNLSGSGRNDMAQGDPDHDGH